MARQRDYAAEYQRRQERARERGFSSYGAERAAKAKQSRTSSPSSSGSRTRTRDYAAEYRRRHQRAKDKGYSGYAQQRRMRAQRKQALDTMRAAFGDRPRFNAARIAKRLEEMEEEDLLEVLDYDAREMQLTMIPGKPANHDHRLFYH